MDKYVNANMVFSKFARDYMSLKKDLPIRPSEMGVLNIILKREGAFTPLMIAELLDVSKSMITAHITVLEKKGYVYKDFALNDKRSFYVRPTQKAKALTADADKKTDEQLQKIESELGKENFLSLVELLDKTQKILEQEKLKNEV